MKNVIYVRVSSKGQDYTRQIEELKSYCLSKGIEDYIILKEKVSGYNGTRKEWDNLKGMVSRGEVQNILIWEISRLGRRIVELITFIEDCSNKGINIHIHNIGLDSLSNEGKKNPYTSLILSVLANLAEMESERLSERIKSGLHHRKEIKGLSIGRKPGAIMSKDDLWKRYSGKKGLKEDLKTLSVRKCASIHKISCGTVQSLKKMIAQ